MESIDDTDQIGSVMADFLAAVSFPSGGKPDYSHLPELFTEGARLIRNVGELPEIATIDEFVEGRQAQVDSGDLTAFEEVEVAQVTEVFGRVGHRLSTYRKRGMLGGGAFDVRGVISTQFVKTPAGWRMSAMAWDDERPGLTIPDRYR
jgi:hypothetical protein